MKIIILIGVFTISSVFSQEDYCEKLDGIWIMTEKSPVSPDNSNPYGIANTKWFFDSINTKIYVSNPEDDNKDNSLDYDCKNNIVSLYDNKKPIMDITVVSINSDYLKTSITRQSMLFGETITHQTYTKNHFQFNSENYEPTSIEVIKNNDKTQQLNILDINYDENNYNELSINKRIIGVWEVNKYENLPKHELPPFGFLNDIY